MLFYKTRQEEVGKYILRHKCTIRAAAAHFGLSKSTVHLDVSHRLKTINPGLYARVKRVLETNHDGRHIRGGEATKRHYAQAKVSKVK